MATGGASLHWGGLERAMGKAMQKLGDTQPLMASIGEALVSGTLKRFQHEEEPSGKKWPKSKRAALEGGQTLTNKGGLKGSIDKYATRDKVMVGSNLPYARIHQMGGTIRPKKGKFLKFKGLDGEDVFVKEVTLPPRPFLGISAADMKEAKATIADFLKDAFKA